VALDNNSKNICKDLIESLPENERTHFLGLMNYTEIPYIDDLHKGLTFLAQSCMELGVLFSKFENEKEIMNHNSIVKRMTVGYLFEVYNSLWDWIGKPAKAICEHKGIEDDDFQQLKKEVDKIFSNYVPLLKAVRNGAFHTKEASDKDWSTTATRLLFHSNIPQKLRHSLYEYGYKINVAAHENGVYGLYPGIGGFAAIIPGQRIVPMKDLYLAGTNIKYTPDSPV